MQKIIFFLFLFCSGTCFAQQTSDTIHVVHYNITVDTINYVAKSIQANTIVRVKSKLNSVNKISLSLLHLTIDSIISGTTHLSYEYTDTVLHITPLSVLNQNDSVDIGIYYHGQPQADPSGWGGFYFNGSYAFNLGVGFDATPHVFGRCWFPCIDEFTDKSTYSFHVNTPNSYKAFCNGTLQGITDLGNGLTRWDWSISNPMNSYLASIAVAPFYTIHRTYSGIPFEMGVMQTDTVLTLASFANVGTAISTFINDYGPYPWEKIGYVMTPVTYGGMENASSIHVSKVFVDGTLNYETLFMHELSHMWWGDKVTCKTEQDMWLNEGFATFNEHIFTEAQYGASAYKTSYHTDHREVLQFSHIDDGGYLALNNVPHAYTYATLSVYKKGALIAHTLRNYLGDAKFFQGCRDYMSNLAYGNATSFDFRDQLSTSSGINMNDFFDGWVFTPGFPAFLIDSTTSVPNGSNYDVTLYTRQKQKGNTHIYKMNVEFNFTDGINDTNIVFVCNAATNAFSASLPFNPSFISVDRNEKMMDAIVDFELPITTTGNKIFSETNMTVNVVNLGSAPSTIRIEHNFVKPDDYVYNPGIRVSDYHYWKVDGIFASGLHAKSTFFYDGSTSSSSGYLDNTLITGIEDSVVILYRAGAGHDWTIVNGYTKSMGNHNDKVGNITIDTLKRGEYALGYYDNSVRGISRMQLPASLIKLNVYPNPSSSNFIFEFKLQPGKKGTLRVYSGIGTEIFRTEIFSHQTSVIWDTYGLSNGTYFAEIESDNTCSGISKLILLK